jgi:hypothetical protein
MCKRISICVALAATIALGAMNAPASASPPPGEPGCTGDLVSSIAQNPQLVGSSNLGEVIDNVAHTSQPLGTTFIPFVKEIAPLVGCDL